MVARLFDLHCRSSKRTPRNELDRPHRLRRMCHTAQLTYKGKQVRIDGGVANTLDFMAYMYAFDDTLQAKSTDTAKF
jgi:hypothetical protein